MNDLMERIAEEARRFSEAHGIRPVSDVEQAMRVGAMLAMEASGKRIREISTDLERRQMVSNLPH